MEFYEILQKDPAVIKQCIRQSRDQREIFRLMTGMALRAVLIVVFAIIFISPMTGLFGEQNSAMAVVIFCILLAVRFVDFNRKNKIEKRTAAKQRHFPFSRLYVYSEIFSSSPAM